MEKFIISKDYFLVEVDGESMLLPKTSEGVARHSVFGINEVGTAIVKYLETEHTVSELLSYISTLYHVSQDVLRNDVEGYLDDLLTNSIIMRV